MNNEELKLLNEMKDNCLNGAKYIDPKSMEKYNLLRKLEDRINELQQENQLLKKVFDEVLEWGQYQDRYTWKQLEGILSKSNELKDSDVDE